MYNVLSNFVWLYQEKLLWVAVGKSIFKFETLVLHGQVSSHGGTYLTYDGLTVFVSEEMDVGTR